MDPFLHVAVEHKDFLNSFLTRDVTVKMQEWYRYGDGKKVCIDVTPGLTP